MPFIDAFPEPPRILSTSSLLNFIFDLEPGDTGLKRKIWVPRLKVDGVEVGIRDRARVSETESIIGETVTVTLLDDADKILFTEDAVIEFGIGQTIAGVWDESTFETLMTDARASGIGQTVEGPPGNMTDRVNVTIISGASNKLNKTSEAGLIIYDSNRVTISDSDLKPVKDSAGNVYTPEVVGIPGLTLAHLFERVFITECGFSDYETSLPEDDYPIERYDVKMGGRFYDGLKGFIGMYKPAVTPIDDVLWVLDTTTVQPTGFPDPEEITLERPLNINTQSSREQLDGLLVQYVGLENNYDFTTFRFEYADSARGAVVVEGETIYVEFRKANPLGSTVVREIKNIENRRSLLNGTEIDLSSEVTEFTSNGWPAHIRKTAQKLLPPISDPTLAPIMQEALVEKTEIINVPHPFKPRTQYTARRTLKSEGLILSDTDNPLADGTPYKRDLATGHRGGNVAEGQTFATGPIRTREDTTVPLRNGTVSVREYEVDEVAHLVILDRIVEKPGEVGLSGVSSTQEELLVLAPGVTDRNNDFIDNFPVGELPLRYAEPLADRVIIQRQAGAGSVNLPVVGYDRSLRKGMPRKVGDRNGASLGNYTITGREIDISSEGVVMNLTGRRIPGSDAPLQQIPTYARSLNSGQVISFTIPVLCTDGYTMRVLQGSVANVLIEARHVGDAFVNIELLELDLSPWDGLTEDFDIRITVGVIAAPVRVQFDVNVDVAI